MSLAAYSYAWDHAADLTGAQFKVLMYLADRHNGQTGRCCPSLAAIIAATGLARSNVQRALYALEAAGVVTVDRTPRQVSRYHFPPAQLSTTGRAHAAQPDTTVAAHTRPPRRAHAAQPAAQTRRGTGMNRNRTGVVGFDDVAPAGTDVRAIMQTAARAERDRMEQTG